MNKVALFDFCETLVSFQTADAFVDYVREKLNDARMYKLERMQNSLRRLKIIQIIEKITRYRFSINKRVKLWQLKGHDFAELQELAREYYRERIKPNIIPDILEEMLELKSHDYSVMLVSGGYDLYLKYFVDEYALSGVISTKIGFDNNVCTGKFDGIDCLGEGKIKLLNLYYPSKPQYSVAFSDSISDLPFLKWVDQGFVISCSKHQSWSKNNDLKEIIWIPKK